MEVPAVRLNLIFEAHKEEYMQKALDILSSGRYIMGKELAAFESAFAEYIGTRHCVGLASGLDALWITFRILGIGSGDEVIVQGNTFIAGVMGISINGAVPVFAEPDEHFSLSAKEIEKHITSKTKAVLVTHLYGMMTPMDEIVQLCRKYDLRIVEDCAQAHGASYRGKKAGSFGDVGCFSFFPTKNLGAFGDGGAVVLNDSSLYEKFLTFRNYGSEKKYHNSVVGTNSRLDELQAGLLGIRLKYLDEMNEERCRIAEKYFNNITNPLLSLPVPHTETVNVWHQFVVRCAQRDALQRFLRSRNIDTIIHYPIPPHLSEAYRYLGLGKGSLPKTEMLADTVLSLPLYNGLSAPEQNRVIETLNEFSE
ncbi:MAG: DegT/DnrJ/EryC1/StrS family aminotransferase [Oscillospiraceae bacterium]|nr:DegT/DnrJ/EryC1/StrS family aminotransferase [Oscillospiraceae bacterium]